MGDEPREEGIAVVSRSFEILAAFEPGEQAPLSLAEITRRVVLPKTTTLRLLAALVNAGVVERGPAGYRLGMLLFELGERVPRQNNLREAALPFMEDLYEVTHDTVHLAVLDGTDVLYVERIRGHRQQPQLASRVGGRLPAYSTGVGKALLAFTPESAAEVLRQTPLPALTPYTLTTKKLLLAELAKIHSTRIAHDRDENAIGINCVATPVMVGGRAVAAISVSGPSDRIAEERVGSAVRTAALGLQRLLASHPVTIPT